jgi:hypothetical protein
MMRHDHILKMKVTLCHLIVGSEDCKRVLPSTKSSTDKALWTVPPVWIVL